MTWWRRFLGWFRPTPKPEPPPTPNPPGPKYASQGTRIEPFSSAYLATLHDAERARHALPRLLLDTRRLEIDAQARATQAAAVNLTGPHLHDGFAPRPGDVKTGENAAMGQADSESLMADWMSSPGHRANILDPGFSRIGCGRATSKDLVTYWYCLFAG